MSIEATLSDAGDQNGVGDGIVRGSIGPLGLEPSLIVRGRLRMRG